MMFALMIVVVTLEVRMVFVLMIVVVTLEVSKNDVCSHDCRCLILSIEKNKAKYITRRSHVFIDIFRYERLWPAYVPVFIAACFFTPHFLTITVEVKASGLPHVLKLWLL